MFIMMANLQATPGHKEELIQALLHQAKEVSDHEPGCTRYDIIQDGGDPNKIWLYEVFQNDAAFQAHIDSPHTARFMETTKAWRGDPELISRGSYNVWPTDANWK